MKQLSVKEQQFKEYLKKNNIAPFSAVNLEDIEKERLLFQEWAGNLVFPFEELYINARDDAPIRVRVFNPNSTGKTIFFLPGNGYSVAHLLEANTVAASRIAKFSGQRVVFIDFRLMPPNEWPTPMQDVQDVINACVHEKAIPEIDPDKIILSGYSAGAHISALLGLNQHRGFPIKQILLVGGPFDLTFSQQAFATDEALDYICKRANLPPALAIWNISEVEAALPSFSPLFAENFTGFPNTVIIIGEFDGVRSDSEALYLKLKDHGVSVKKIVLPGQTHNDIIFNQALGDENDPALVISSNIET